jgi:DNA-binding CsgD family transcriptional regulator
MGCDLRRGGGAGLMGRRQWPELTPRELEVLALVAEGWSSPRIAARLCLSAGTVRNHLARIYVKLGADNRAHAVGIALRGGLLTDRETPPA